MDDVDQSGGRGWGIREQRPAPASAWVGGTPAYGSGYTPAAGLGAPTTRRSRAGLGIVTLLLLVLVAAAGIFYYLVIIPEQGLGSGTHTLTTPGTLGGYALNTNSDLQSMSQLMEAGIESPSTERIPGVQQAVVAFYGSTDGTADGANAEYFLTAVAYDHALTSADLTTLGDALAGFDYSTSTAQTSDGVTFHCGPETGSDGTGPACLWVDGNVAGTVAGASGVSQSATLSAAEQARDSAES